jgi:hypothetical protein
MRSSRTTPTGRKCKCFWTAKGQLKFWFITKPQMREAKTSKTLLTQGYWLPTETLRRSSKKLSGSCATFPRIRRKSISTQEQRVNSVRIACTQHRPCSQFNDVKCYDPLLNGENNQDWGQVEAEARK